MSELKISVSGIRGIWGKSLNLSTLMNYTRAFGNWILRRNGRTVILGRDARPTGRPISLLVAGILNSLGIDVIDCGVVPTPTVLFGVRKLNCDGAIVITASHNPPQWNALKLVNSRGLFLNESELQELLKYLGEPITEAPYNQIGQFNIEDKISDLHIHQVINNVDAASISKHHYRVLFDPVNSAGSLIGQWLLTGLECSVRTINNQMNGDFQRGAEPVIENLQDLKAIMKQDPADVGFALDPDADRLAVVDETGEVYSEEITLALAVESVLSRPNQKKGNIVVNMSTSRMVDDIALRYGVNVYRTKVGEANVVEGILSHNALIGGEGNGGVIYPTINPARDSLVGMALILELMARRNAPLSQIIAELPHYIMRKKKYEFSENIDALYRKLKDAFPNTTSDETDGLRLDIADGSQACWVHIRPSNTEPVVRVIGEASDPVVLDEVLKKVGSFL